MNELLSVEEAHALLRQDGDACILVDVRSAQEFAGVHAAPAVHIPLERIGAPEMLQSLSHKKVLCICQSGGRGKQAASTLRKLGLEDVANVEGGTAAWIRANLPVIRGAGGISMERQVRIAAGSLVFLGSLLGLTVSAWFSVVPIFVGCGLVFSGITDTCGMAILLARCPWNTRARG